MSNPACPVTGEPATRLVQWVGARFLAGLWKLQFRADARPSFGAVERFGLWESPTGLYFFDPPIEGDEAFYKAVYGYVQKRNLWPEGSQRREFVEAARRVQAGDRVLDVGCGFGAFRQSVPQARYTGLDPHFAKQGGAGDVRDELLSQHLVQHAGSYDMVCAFQVIEHVREPLALFAQMVQAARPGGLAIASVPHRPSAHTRIPNFLVNAPPHHLTWWTREALAALAQRSGAVIEAVESVDWDEADSIGFWIERCSLVRCRSVHYRNSLAWHASFAASYYAGRVLNAIRKLPAGRDEGPSLMLVARRP